MATLVPATAAAAKATVTVTVDSKAGTSPIKYLDFELEPLGQGLPSPSP